MIRKHYCIRCDKDVGNIIAHTCSPSKNWRKAMKEGMRIMLNTVQYLNEEGYAMQFIIEDCEDLIKQYSGDE